MSFMDENESPFESNLEMAPDFEHNSQVLSSCINGEADLSSLAAMLPKPNSGFYMLIALRAPEPAQASSAISGAYAAAQMGDDTLFVTAQEHAQSVAETLLAQHPDAQAALSIPFDSADDIIAQKNLLSFCLDEHVETPVIYAEDHAMAYINARVSESPRFKSLAHPALYKLAEYDKHNRSDLLNTLRVYLENDRNAQRCADELYLHRNSLQYRVRRIQEITGLDLNDAQLRSYLRVSFLLISEDRL